MKLFEIDSVSFSRDGFLPYVKSPIIWGNKGNESWPLCYLTRPKSMNLEDWNEFLDAFDFTLRRKI